MDSAQPPSKTPAAFLHSASVLLVEHRDSTGSSFSYHETSARDAPPQENDAQPVTLGLSIRRTRLIAFTLVMLVLIVGFTVWFHHGLSLMNFDSHDKNATEQTKLLDDYNSYSGNVSTLFAKPVELFVTVAVQVIILRFLADTFTRPEMSWKVSGLTLLLGAGVGYMISNGFNALNVQLRPETITTVISPVDLGRDNYEDPLTKTFIAAQPRSESELSPNNSVSNTLLRTVLSTEAAIGTASCKYSELRDGMNTLTGTADQVDTPFLNVGVPQREWQSRILQQALPSEKLRLIVNPTDKSANAGAKASALPMEASRAAMLFNSAMTTGTYFFPWGVRRDYVDKADLVRRYRFNDSAAHNVSDAFPRINGLFPPDNTSASNEMALREYFIPAALAAASRQFAMSNNTKTSDIVMEFSHTQISPNIVFDALTFEVEVDPALLSTSTSGDNATRYTELNQRFQCPVAQHCLVPKTLYRAVKPMYDSPAQVVAFRMCTNWQGSDMFFANITIQNNTILRHVGSCADGESEELLTDAMMITSIGKRLVADTLEQNVSVSGNSSGPNTDAVRITNLRKIYSFTIGRLGWQFTDLSATFDARCEVGDSAKCLGLELPLSRSHGSSTSVDSGAAQRLVVGKQAIRHAQATLRRPASRVNFDKTTLVAVAEPPEVFNSTAFYQAMAGDLLLPHNVKKITWDLTSVHPQCDLEAEKRIMALCSQHQYMEHSLQAAYTAGTYFLFQSAVVREEIKVSSTSVSLAFQRNSQAISVWVSTPAQNMWLTLAGCIVLVVGLAAAMVKSIWFKKHDKDVLVQVTEPHAIARVMLDERNYPPMFLHRNVLEKEGAASVDEFSIAALSLQQQQDAEHDASKARQHPAVTRV